MSEQGQPGSRRPPWLLISSHGLVLFYIASHPDETIRVIAETLGLTQRRVVAVVKDLAEAGLIEVKRLGRRNSYRVVDEARFLHRTVARVRVGDFIRIMKDAGEPSDP